MFSCDVLASETQSAPLWEEVSKTDSTSKRRETADQNEVGTSKTIPRKRPGPWHSEGYGKRSRMQEQYTECRLCELNFNNELELEEHLFSILHHRSLNTEFGERHHLCNLCGIACSNLSDYVNHLKNSKHRSKYNKRKAEIEVGSYKRPANDLARYTSSFMHPPTRAKQKKMDEEVNKKVDEIFSDRAPSRNSSPRRQVYDHCYYGSNDYERRPHHNARRQDYPDWHPMGQYGGQRSPWNRYHNSRYDDMNSQGQFNRYQEYDNPYERGGWFPGPYTHYHRMGPRIYDMEKSVYRQPNEDGPWQNEEARKGNSRPSTPTFEHTAAFNANVHQGRCSLTNDQARTKELVARAHQVIQNGQNVANKPTTKKKKRKGKNNTSQPQQNPIANKKKMTNNTLSQKNACKTSITKSPAKLPRRESPGSNLHVTRQGAMMTRSLHNSISVTVTQSSSLMSSNSSFTSQPSSSSGTPRVMLEKLGANKKVESKPAASNSPRNQSVLEKFRDQLSKELGPARMKKTPQRRSVDSLTNESSSGGELAQSRGVSNPETETENIRAQFRKILDDIDQPVMSASEVLHNAKQNESSIETSEISLTSSASWAESNRVTSAGSDTLNPLSMTMSEKSSQNLTLDKEPGCSSLSETITLHGSTSSTEKQRSLSQDRCAALQRSISIDSEKSTPTRSVISLSSDVDTPTNKKRQNPQPNLNRARSRITSKQKDSPDVPIEIRQAKLKQLLQKYDRVKKNSPEATNSLKKTPGPRFGIDLHLQSRPMETMDMEDFAKDADLVEILPEKRARSLSESDSKMSFTTAATESTVTLSLTSNLPDFDNQKTIETPILQKQQQRTSTPSEPPQSNPQNLNEELLKMSEREETLHASVRSLSLQEANVQSEIDNRTAVLKALQEQLDKLTEKKLCVEALKRRHEGELEKLRQDRLTLLRGSVSGTHAASNSSPSNIFQDVTQPSRRTSLAPHQSERVVNDIPTTPTSTVKPVDATQSLKTTHPVLPDFDLSKVKSESNSAEDDSCLFPTPTNPAASKQDLDSHKGNECQPLDVNISGMSDSICNGNSTEFYSFSNENNATNAAPQTSEVDRILAKYSNHSTSISNKDGTGLLNDASLTRSKVQKRKQKTPTRRQSPRRLQKEKLLMPNAFAFPNQNVTQTVVYDVPEGGDSPKLTDAESLPKFFKAHELPLVGMHFIKDGLVTCSLDETIALLKPHGKKHSLSLGATPTAMTAVSEDITSLAFVATQKLISKTQTSDDSVIINKMEHWLDIFIIQDSKDGAEQHTFQSHGRLKLKTRVLCVHYDKQTLFCGMRDGMAAIITLDSLYQPEDDINILECHSHSAITCLTTGMEGARRILCCGSTDCTVSVRDAVEGLLLRTIQGHTKTVTCLQLVHNELYSASVDRLILCHNLNTGNLLHRFTGHVGVVRALHVISNVMVTLCSDRNIRFFDTKTSRLIQKPKTLSSLPLFACVPSLRNGLSSTGDNKIVYVGCEDSTVMRIQFPQIQPIRSSPARNLNLSLPTRSKQRSSSKSPPRTVNLTGKFQCQWEGCFGAGTFVTVEDLGNHVFSVHIDTSELTPIGDHTLKVGTCCQWESCTHYFAPELDTVRDITAHIQRHFDNLKKCDQNGVDPPVRNGKDKAKSPGHFKTKKAIAEDL